MARGPGRLIGIVLIGLAGFGFAYVYIPSLQFPLRGKARPSAADEMSSEIATSVPATPVELKTQPQTDSSRSALLDRESTWLAIPKIAVTAPIVLDVDGASQTAYNAALEKGVAHMRTTAQPTDTAGNSFIFGHSSRFPATGTVYDTIFVQLNQLAPGDTFELTHDSGRQRFRVFRSQAISPNDTSVLEQDDRRIVTLMTCWPPKTTLKRWIVQAELTE